MELSVGVGELRSTVGNFPSLFSEQKADKKGGGFPGLLLGGGGERPHLTFTLGDSPLPLL